MFDINFISKPGIQNETSNANWSFLDKKNQKDKNEKLDSKKSKTSLIQQNSWTNYVFVIAVLGFIVVIAIVNSLYMHVKPDLMVLNQVIDLIDECNYIETLQLKEANFSKNHANVTISSEDFTTIQSLTQNYRMEKEIFYEMYQKGKYSFLHLIFPWKGNITGGDITILKALADKTVFSNMISIKDIEDIFEIQGTSSDIISFLLQMAENDQIQKFNFSIFHKDSGNFNLTVQLSLI